MQTQLAPQHQSTPEGTKAQEVLRQCVHCGFCNATCPTYRLTGNELDGPRGRIYLMKQVFEGQTPTRTTQAHLDHCIGCRHCESTCPSGVQYHELLAVGQPVVDAQVERPWRERVLRWGLIKLMPSPWFTPALKLGQAVRPLLPSALRDHVPARAPLAPPAWPDPRKSLHARRVLLLKGCVQPGLRPHIDASTARVLDAIGIRAVVASASTCCGAVQGHMGDLDGAKDRARRNIDAWWPYIESPTPVEALLINASGCGAWVKDYGGLLADDPAYADKARRVAALARDPGEMLANWLPLLKRKLGKRAQAGLGAVTFHPPCSLSHAQKLSSAAKAGPIESGLRELGFEVKLAVQDSHQCCGAGGAYSVLQPEMSRQLRDLKLKALQATEPHLIASANIGCIVHLQSGTDTPVKHWLEVLDEALSR
ncbi:MAG TPA: glycolate oxidase subunit GlcF [Aquabacterium sp.]|uniref:glycolate oxidase subunit GlcF n=1 Tax=Aquabacterium sp. TaxID=1872578 RepID=UPI002E377ACD|nr:glycolate oxidase subunit GlcF [Aquabacterium sp.]HEX5355656.1 glycolate oxidase subunit GlcF [Aquabacterium sp.]